MYTDGLGENIEIINFNSASKIFQTIGYTIYVFEGIGVVMPIMQACENPEIFDKIFLKAVITVSCFIMMNGVITYLSFGD
jgi:hypothetical protein